MMKEKVPLLLLLPLRLFTGWVFLSAGVSKIAAGWLDRPEIVKIVGGWLKEGRPYHFFAPFLAQAVIPYPKMFSLFVVGGELVVGIALLAGLLTRGAALAGLLLIAAFFFGRGDTLSANPTAPFVLILFTFVLVNPGRVLGADAALRGKVPRWLV